jgi:hypothetical protein
MNEMDYEAAYSGARYDWTETFYFQLEKKEGSRDALLALTSGKPREEVEAFIHNFFAGMAPENSGASALLHQAHRFLFDKEAILDALEAAPWSEDA